MIDISNLDNMVLTITPIVMLWIQAMKKSVFADYTKKLLPYLSFIVGWILIYFIYSFDYINTTIAAFFVGLAANGLYDQTKPIITKFIALLPNDTKDKININFKDK